MKLISIGYANYINSARLVSLSSPDSAPIKRVISEARENGMLIDATCGRRTRSVILMDSKHIILSALQTDTIAGRLEGKGDEK